MCTVMDIKGATHQCYCVYHTTEGGWVKIYKKKDDGLCGIAVAATMLYIVINVTVSYPNWLALNWCRFGTYMCLQFCCKNCNCK